MELVLTIGHTGQKADRSEQLVFVVQ